MCTEPEDISSAFPEYYKNLFTSTGHVGVEDCIIGVEARVTMNEQLLRSFTEEEVSCALSQMQSLKYPSSDVF